MSEPYQILESELGRWCGRPDTTVVCNSGSAALHLALEALQLLPGSEVLVPELTFIACARAVVLAGLTPVFVDCDERLLMSWLQAGQALAGGPVKAAMMVHVYGRRLEGLDNPQSRYGVQIVEDLAEAHGVAPHPATDAACWSFYANKHIHGEEGGAVAFRDPEHARLARALRSQGYGGASDWRHIERGMNYRLANSLAVPILRSLSQFEEDGKRMRAAERVLDGECPDEWRMPPRDATWMYDFRVPDMSKECQDEVVSALKAAGIIARHGFYPMSLQREFRGCRRVGDAKNAEKASREVVCVALNDRSAETFRIVRSVISSRASGPK